jgi:hypothetical protein
MLLQGLPLSEGTWQLYVNEPDLDALLASWLLLNHNELLREENLLVDVMPLVRVEGTIDAHGLDRAALTGLPPQVYEMHKTRIDELLKTERALKAENKWQSSDALAYAQMLLDQLDEVLYPAGYLNDLQEISEIAQVPIKGGKLAVLCRSKQGIYAVEAHLKRRYDKQLAVVVLDSSERAYTLRQSDPFLEKNLEDVYHQLNKRDPAVLDHEEGNCWGGSADIGGSPRASGSDLSGEEVLRVVQGVYSGSWFRRMMRRITSIGG